MQGGKITRGGKKTRRQKSPISTVIYTHLMSNLSLVRISNYEPLIRKHHSLAPNLPPSNLYYLEFAYYELS